MNFKRFTLISFAALSTFGLVACGADSSDVSSEKVSVGIIQYAEHEALDLSKDGFLEALEDAGYKEGNNLTVDFQNAQGDQANLQTMVDQLAREHDLNFAIATPAAQAMLNVDTETPSVFTAVTDPIGAELVDSLEKPGGNMTGSIDATDVSGQIDMLVKVVSAVKKAGIFYNSSEVKSSKKLKKHKKHWKIRELKWS